jgi:hypothetical protein
LLDIALILEVLQLDEDTARRRLRTVFHARGHRDPPLVLPTPPAAWRADYATLTRSTAAEVMSFDDAFVAARALYARLLAPPTTMTPPGPRRTN